MIFDTHISDTCNGPGVALKDVGINILSCKIDRNESDGIAIDCTDFPMPVRVLQPEVKQFLKRRPLSVAISDCEIYYNQKNGILIQEFWKGSIKIDECLLVGNIEYGLCCSNKNPPILQQDDADILN